AVEQQVGDLEERARFRELLDRVAAVTQDALLAVDEGDAAAAGAGVAVAGVERDPAALVAQLLDVDADFALAAADQGQVHRLAVVGQGGASERLLSRGRGGHVPFSSRWEGVGISATLPGAPVGGQSERTWSARGAGFLLPSGTATQDGREWDAVPSGDTQAPRGERRRTGRGPQPGAHAPHVPMGSNVLRAPPPRGT